MPIKPADVSSLDDASSHATQQNVQRRHSLAGSVDSIQNMDSLPPEMPINMRERVEQSMAQSAQASALAQNIANIENTEARPSVLRNLIARARHALSTAWQWLRNNVLCCFSNCCTSDDVVEAAEPSSIRSFPRERSTLYDPEMDAGRLPHHLAILSRWPLNLPEEFMDPSTTAIVGFFYGLRTTVDEVTLGTIMGYSSLQLEGDHHYIQYLLPSPEVSDIVPAAPLASLNTRRIFLLNPHLRELYLLCVSKMLEHWQLQLNENNLIERASDFNPATNVLLARSNHNQLRVTRMLKSLAMLGFTDTARSLQDVMLRAARENNVPTRVQCFWQDAFNDIPLGVADDFLVLTYEDLARNVLGDGLGGFISRVDMLEQNMNRLANEIGMPQGALGMEQDASDTQQSSYDAQDEERQ